MKLSYGASSFEKLRSEGRYFADKTTTDAAFNEMIGFTEQDVLPILRHLGNEDALEEVRAYYDGYRFSEDAETTDYNSDMILYYATEYKPELRTAKNMIDINVVSDYRKIRAILSLGDQSMEEDILSRIVEQESIRVNRISELFVLTQETEFLFDDKTLISLLFYMGCLTIAEVRPFAVALKIPNIVLKSLLRNSSTSRPAPQRTSRTRKSTKAGKP